MVFVIFVTSVEIWFRFYFYQGKTNLLTFHALHMLKGMNLIFIVRKIFSSFNLVQNVYEVVHMSDDVELIGVCRRVGKNYTPTKVCSFYILWLGCNFF
jgi:hypothetical protein